MNNQKASSGQKALSLIDMSSAFVLFGLGISLSILVFLLELIYTRISDHYFNTVPARVNDKKVKATTNTIGIKKGRAILVQAAKAKVSDGRTQQSDPVPAKVPLVIRNSMKQDDIQTAARPTEIKQDTSINPISPPTNFINRGHAIPQSINNRKLIISTFDEILEI